MNKPNFTAQLTNKAAIEEVAASVGCLLTTGPHAGQGSIRQLLEDIGAGEIILRRRKSRIQAIIRDAAKLVRLDSRRRSVNLRDVASDIEHRYSVDHLSAWAYAKKAATLKRKSP